MKPALVLGLALAANAMTADSGDNNELFVAPTGKLGDLAQRFPGKIMYDEVADDELGVKYVHLPHIPAPEYVAYDEVADDELGAYVPIVLAKYDEVADDELGVKYVHLPIPEVMAYDDDELAVKYVHLPHITAPEVAAYDDDELLTIAKKPREESKMTEAYMQAMGWRRGQQIKEADDELWMGHDELGRPTHNHYGNRIRPDRIIDNIPVKTKFNPVRFVADDELAITADQYQRLQNIKNPIYSRFDEAADDELAINQRVVQLPAEHVAFDDDELAYVPPVLTKFDEVADDEFSAYVPTVFAKYDEVPDDELRIRPISALPTAEHVAFDDELSFMPIPPKVFVNRDWVKPAKIPVSEALLRDDEADDELLYLGQLIKDGGYIPRPYFDDELRAEKPSHGKTQERTQTKTEKPKRKLRPVADERPAYQDYVL